jgi:hypothetical protein
MFPGLPCAHRSSSIYIKSEQKMGPNKINWYGVQLILHNKKIKVYVKIIYHINKIKHK